MTSSPTPVRYEPVDHTGHDIHPDYEQTLADYLADAGVVAEAIANGPAGWTNVTVLDPIDCEVPQAPDAVDLQVGVPAGQLGTLRLPVRVVRGRAATVTDLHMAAANLLQVPFVVLVADQLDDQAARHVAGCDRFLLRTLADVGLSA